MNVHSLEDIVAQVVHNGACEVTAPDTQEPPSQRKGDVNVEIHVAGSFGMIDEITENPNDMTEQNLMAILQEVI